MILYVAIYRFLVGAYALIIRIAALFNPKAKLFIRGRQGLVARVQQALAKETRPRIWMHCASLGEFEQGRPLLERIKKEYPGYALVLTFFSPSGYEVRKNYAGADHIFYLPFDKPSNAKHFLDIVHPSLSLFVKYELWYFYLSELKKRNIPTLLISAFFRKGQVFFSWYGQLPRYMLRCFSHLFVQNGESKTLLDKIGIHDVSVTGDTRFDRVIELAKEKPDLPVVLAFAKDSRVVVAGSTWKEDELFLSKILPLLPDYYKMILVPHEVHAAHIAEIENLFKGNCIKWSEWKEDADARVLIVDKVGFLSKIYAYAYVAWIGGAFGKAGVHNVLEAAVYGLPCAYGPVFHQFIEAQELIDAGAALTTSDANVFAAMAQWQPDSEKYELACADARSYVLSKGGATSSIMDHLIAHKLLFS